ncbi:hypothetical protein [Microbacterium sp. ProA8]|uniref:hypothetical protein n=1 Tax=Microbacterium chionoecetis TaxID=3153754 RepID=UPI0032639E55
MDSTTSARGTHLLRLMSGAGALFGGVGLACTAIIHSGQAIGCVGPEECASRPMRTMTPLIGVMGTAALVLLVLGVAGLALLMIRAGLKPTTAGAGLILLGMGVGLLLTGGIIQTALGDFPWMPLFVGPGVIAVLAGIALVAWCSAAVGLLPLWMAILVGVSAAGALASNEQNTTILFVVPFAIALALMGGYLCVSALPSPRSRAYESRASTS